MTAVVRKGTFMDFELSKEHRSLVDLAREVSKPFAARTLEYDRTASFPEQNFKEIFDAGLHKLTVPKEYGGHGLWDGNSYLPYYLVLIEMARHCSSTSQLLQVHSHGVGIVARNGTAKQLARYMPGVAEDGHLYASCGSEASVRNSGPEKFDSVIRSRGAGYTLSGFKGFASIAPAADYYVIWALVEGTSRMDEGMVFAMVPKGREGVTLEDNWDALGMRATVSWNIHLKDVELAADEVVGGRGDWVQKDPRTFTLGFASNHLGQAKAILDFVKKYVVNRTDLHGATVAMAQIGEAEAHVTAAESVLVRAARLWEAGDFDNAERISMQALFLAKHAGLDFVVKAFDICGARSTFNDQLLNLYYRDVRTFTLHFREDRMLQMLGGAAIGGEFHSKARYGRKLPVRSEVA
jgi:alkylation response protein AidB-like acyl-CoA dehydrogenase